MSDDSEAVGAGVGAAMVEGAVDGSGLWDGVCGELQPAKKRRGHINERGRDKRTALVCDAFAILPKNLAEFARLVRLEMPSNFAGNYSQQRLARATRGTVEFFDVAPATRV